MLSKSCVLGSLGILRKGSILETYCYEVHLPITCTNFWASPKKEVPWHPVALCDFILWHYVAHPMALCGNGRVEIPLLVTCIKFRFFCKVSAHSGMLHRRHVGNKSENVNRGSQRHKSEFFCSVTPTLQGMNCHIFPLEKVAMEPLFSTVRTTDCSLRFGFWLTPLFVHLLSS